MSKRLFLSALAAALVLQVVPVAIHVGSASAAPAEAMPQEPLFAARPDRAESPLDLPARLELKDVPLEIALDELRASSRAPLAFSPSLLPRELRVSCSCRTITVGQALDRLLAGTDLRYATVRQQIVVERIRPILEMPAPTLRSNFALAAAPLRTQDGGSSTERRQVLQGTITGRVSDASTGRGLSGAAVEVVGTQRGAFSGADGSFTIPGMSDGPHRVRVSMIGYAAQEQGVLVVTGQTSTLNFQLAPEAVTIEGVVAVGYGTQRRRDVTGSVASVSAARLEDLPNINVAQALQGAAPGVSITTTGAGAEPRQNIQIRGQNSIKASNAPLIVVDGIPFNGNLAEINQSDVASIDILKDASAGAIYGARGANGVILVTTRKGRVGAPSIVYEGYAGVQEMANRPRLMTGPEFAEFKCQRLSEYMTCAEALVPTERANLEAGQFTDWLGLATRRGFQQQHTLSVSGGSADTRFYLSGSALNTQGIAINDQFDRYTARVNLNQQLGSWVELGVSTQLAQVDRSGLPASFSGAFTATPLENAFEADGRTIALTPLPEDPQRTNPLSNLLVIDDDLSRRVIASGFAEARLPFVEGLSFRINSGVEYGSRDTGRYFGRDTRPGRDNLGRAITGNERGFDWTLENVLGYTRDIGLHSVTATALYGAQGFEWEAHSLTSQGFPNDVLTYRQAHVARSILPSFDVRQSGLLSQMGRLNYGYDGRYLVTVTARRDGFSGFGDNYKYGVFPSIALAWNASEESFWNFGTFNSLKLRASYGQNGNQAIQPYQTLARLSERSSVDAGSTWPGFVPATLGNQNLRWETTTSMNAGADFGLLHDRIRGTLDVYSSRTHDLLLDRLVSPVHGIAQMVENIGKVGNRGIELSLSGVPFETPRFGWTTDFNIAANRNRIIDLYGDATDDILNQWFIGHSVNTNFGYEFAGVWQIGDDIANSAQPTARPGDTRVRDVNGDGKVDAADRTFLGTSDPSYTAGLSNTLRAGNLSLSFFVHAVQGVTRYNELILADVAGGAAGSVRNNALYFQYWTPENPINTRWANREGANVFGAGQHDLGVGVYDEASFIRLRDVTISYDLPEVLTSRLGSPGLRVYANGRNLWTHTNWIGLDPELSSQRAIPLERILSVGVNARF